MRLNVKKIIRECSKKKPRVGLRALKEVWIWVNVHSCVSPTSISGLPTCGLMKRLCDFAFHITPVFCDKHLSEKFQNLARSLSEFLPTISLSTNENYFGSVNKSISTRKLYNNSGSINNNEHQRFLGTEIFQIVRGR